MSFLPLRFRSFLTDYVVNYEEYTDAVKDILKDSGVITYLDYNDSSFDRNRADYFYDDCHLSGAGAAEFTSLLCPDLMNADMEETE